MTPYFRVYEGRLVDGRGTIVYRRTTWRICVSQSLTGRTMWLSFPGGVGFGRYEHANEGCLDAARCLLDMIGVWKGREGMGDRDG